MKGISMTSFGIFGIWDQQDGFCWLGGNWHGAKTKELVTKGGLDKVISKQKTDIATRDNCQTQIS